MPMDRRRYPPDWKAISYRIRFVRADGKCEWCEAVNGDPHPVTGSRVVLSVAHLGVTKPDGSPGDKHDKMDNREENLAALCQRCHLNYDRDEHYTNFMATLRRKRREYLQRQEEAGQLKFLWMF